MTPDYESMTPEQREAMWKRQSDARTLAEAEQIKADKERHAAAQQGARELLDEQADRISGLARVAGHPGVHPHHSGPKPKQPTPGGCARYQNPATIGRLF